MGESKTIKRRAPIALKSSRVSDKALLLAMMKKMEKIEKQINELSNIIKVDRKTELNVDEAAAFLGVAKKTVYNLRNIGKLGGFKRGKFVLFLKSELEEIKNEM